MNDRDRLAADLHDERVGCAYALPRRGTAETALCVKNGTHLAAADRLIALGWTRLDEEKGLRNGMSCDPATTHRYERIGTTHRLRCVRCWKERDD